MRQKQREHSSKGRGQPACRPQAGNGTLTNMHPFLEVAATAEERRRAKFPLTNVVLPFSESVPQLWLSPQTREISADKRTPSIFGVGATAVAEPP